MRVLYLASLIEVPNTEHGGTGGTSHALAVTQHLQHLGAEVTMFCGGRGTGPEWIEHDGCSVRRFYRSRVAVQLGAGVLPSPTIRTLRRWASRPYRLVESTLDARHLRSWLKSHPVDLIYERATRYSLAGTFVSRWRGIPLVAEVNDLAFHPLTLDRASAIVVPEPRSLPEKYRGKCHQLPWGVDTARCAPTEDAPGVRSRLGLKGQPTVVFVGSFLPWHGTRAIVEAAPLVLQRFPEARFLMVGRGPDEDTLREQVRSRDLGEHFIFTGLVEHRSIGDYLAAGDVMLAPYTRELAAQPGRAEMACSLKTLEYMAAAKPVVITEVGNRGQLVQDGITGVVIPDALPASLAEAICKLLQHPELSRQLGQQARLAVEKSYSWQKHAESLLEIFNSVAAAAPGP